MSRAFGAIFQVAYVVEDVPAAIAHWTGTMGVGPFYRFPLPFAFETLAVGGRQVAPDTAIFADVAIAHSGETMIELIQPGSYPSTYSEFLASGRRGVHHLGTFADDYDRQLAAARAAGIAVLLEGALPMSRFAYLATDRLGPGTIIELVEPQPPMLELFGEVKVAALAWDGRDPIRNL